MTTPQQPAVLITGCSSGIGYQVAKDLMHRGYKVIASARNQKDVDRLNNEGLFCLQLDLTDSHSINQAFNAALEYSGGCLHGLFNNGAYGQAGAVEDLTREAMSLQFETNVIGTMELTNLAIPIMRQQEAGRIIFNSSVLGFIALKFRGAYSASKYAIEGFADTLRLELNDTNIATCLIEPGPIETQFRSNSYKMFQKYIDRDNSPFRQEYLNSEKRLLKKGAAVPFTLPASSITPKVIHALESNRPKPRYYVTKPTYALGYLKRILSNKLLDKLLLKVSNS
jgi:NAD(P)-dependent dehydrogenase (short-subunit alcohol dehydrogenase family)|tara:strand:- start:1607 stop:2452 length:846 start_codon:yes stop_codon:yes gene_type:complete